LIGSVASTVDCTRCLIINVPYLGRVCRLLPLLFFVSFKNAVAQSLQWTVLLEFLVSLYSFSFVVELFPVPLVTIIGVMVSYSSFRHEHKKVEILLTFLLAVITLVVLAFTLWKLRRIHVPS
jgi:ABC-type sulfate transport system permease subunit